MHACSRGSRAVSLRLCLLSTPSPNIFIVRALLAADLLSKLSGERDRWSQQLTDLDSQLAQLPGAALLLAAFITYLPAHPEDVRSSILPVWARYVTSKVGAPQSAPWSGTLRFLLR